LVLLLLLLLLLLPTANKALWQLIDATTSAVPLQLKKVNATVLSTAGTAAAAD
jgi:hypothetical protein